MLTIDYLQNSIVEKGIFATKRSSFPLIHMTGNKENLPNQDSIVATIQNY